MNISTIPFHSSRRGRARHLPHGALFAFMLSLAAMMRPEITWATQFANVYYDPGADQLVTLRSAPRYIYQLQIPAPPASMQQ